MRNGSAGCCPPRSALAFHILAEEHGRGDAQREQSRSAGLAWLAAMFALPVVRRAQRALHRATLRYKAKDHQTWSLKKAVTGPSFATETLRRPEKRCSGLSSSERGARPFRLARPVAGLRSVFREPNGLLRIVSYANGRTGSGVCTLSGQPALSNVRTRPLGPPRTTIDSADARIPAPLSDRFPDRWSAVRAGTHERARFNQVKPAWSVTAAQCHGPAGSRPAVRKAGFSAPG